MKKIILIFLAVTTSTFASTLSLPEQKTETKQPLLKKTVPCGVLFNFNCQSDLSSNNQIIPSLSISIQTYPNTNNYFQSLRHTLELGEAKTDSKLLSSFFCLQSTFMHYFNNTENNVKFFYHLGCGYRRSYFTVMTKKTLFFKLNGKNQYVIDDESPAFDCTGNFYATIGGGIEIGKLGSNIFGIEGAIEHPFLYLKKGTHIKNLYNPILKIGCFFSL